jgi:hypothetical protein
MATHTSKPRPTSAIVATRLDTPVVAGPMGGTANASEHGYTLYENGELWRDAGKHSYRAAWLSNPCIDNMEAAIEEHSEEVSSIVADITSTLMTRYKG